MNLNILQFFLPLKNAHADCSHTSTMTSQHHNHRHQHTRYDHMKLHDLWLRSTPMNINCTLAFGIRIDTLFRSIFVRISVSTNTTNYSKFLRFSLSHIANGYVSSFLYLPSRNQSPLNPISSNTNLCWNKSETEGKKILWHSCCAKSKHKQFDVIQNAYGCICRRTEMNHDFIYTFANPWRARYLWAKSSYCIKPDAHCSRSMLFFSTCLHYSHGIYEQR